MPLPGSALFERLGRPDEGKDWTHENEVTFVYSSDIDEAWLRRRIEGNGGVRRTHRVKTSLRTVDGLPGR